MNRIRYCLYEKTYMAAFVDKDFETLSISGYSTLGIAMKKTYSIVHRKEMTDGVPKEILMNYLEALEEFRTCYHYQMSFVIPRNYRTLAISWRRLIRERKILVQAYLFYRQYSGA